MDRGRILILGQSKETTYEIRNLFDNKRFELEIALNQEVGKQVLANRQMSLIMIHTEMLKEGDDFFRFLNDRAIEVPVLVLGEEASDYRQGDSSRNDIHCFDKPYVSSDVLGCIDNL